AFSSNCPRRSDGTSLAVLREMRGAWIVIFACACGNAPASPDAHVELDAAADAGDAACVTGPERDGPYTRFTVENDTIGVGGFIDPSVEYPLGASGGLMTYTTVPDPAHVHIAIAASVDAGATWHYQAEVTQAQPITIDTTDMAVCGATTCNGT